jgi:hypothetical protein
MRGRCALPVQAVLYFRRALRLDRHYLSAWTLMGHEYVELKNPPAAIGALSLSPIPTVCCDACNLLGHKTDRTHTAGVLSLHIPAMS